MTQARDAGSVAAAHYAARALDRTQPAGWLRARYAAAACRWIASRQPLAVSVGSVATIQSSHSD